MKNKKTDPTRGDWYELLKKDFQFIGKNTNEEEIKTFSKVEYKKVVKAAIEKAALKYFLEEKKTLKNNQCSIHSVEGPTIPLK